MSLNVQLEVIMTSYGRRCDVMTSHRRQYDIISKSCARWDNLIANVFLSAGASTVYSVSAR